MKPELNKYAGKSIGETPYKDVLNTEGKDVIGANPKHGNRKVIMPLQAGHKQYGESGLVVGDWFKNVGECADDLAVVRSLWTIHNAHGAQLTWQTGRHPRELEHPTIGSWITYGLGTRNENLPEYVVLGVPTGDCCGGAFTHGAAYLGPEQGGVRMNVDAKKPLAFIRPPEGVTPEEQAANLSLLGKLNHFAGIDYPDDQNLRARIKSYELAFQMQTSIPETLQLEKESEATRKLYGLDKPECKAFGEQCLAARRLVERGCASCSCFTAAAAAAIGTRTRRSNRTTPSSQRRWTSRLPGCSRTSSSVACCRTRWWCSAPSSAAHQAPMARGATIIRRRSARGWRARA